MSDTHPSLEPPADADAPVDAKGTLCCHWCLEPVVAMVDQQNMRGEAEVISYRHLRKDLDDDHPVEQTFVSYLEYDKGLAGAYRASNPQPPPEPEPLRFRAPTFDYVKTGIVGPIPALAWLRGGTKSTERKGRSAWAGPGAEPPPWDDWSYRTGRTDVRTRLRTWAKEVRLGHYVLSQLLSVLNIVFIIACCLAIVGDRQGVAIASGLLAVVTGSVNLWLTWWDR